MFIYRCTICAFRRAYLSKNYYNKYMSKLPGKVNKGWGNTLLINGWVKYTKYICSYFYNLYIFYMFPPLRDLYVNQH